MTTMTTHFSTAKLSALAALALSFWLNGVVLIRYFSSHELWGGWFSLTLFVLSIPIAALCISGVRKLLSLSHEQLLPAIVLITALVSLFHGAALTFFPYLYASDMQALLFATAWLVWFCGAVLLPACHMHVRDV